MIIFEAATLTQALAPLSERSEPAPGTMKSQRGGRGGRGGASRVPEGNLACCKISNFGSCKISNFFLQNFANFWRARSRLYQNEILQENMRLTAFFKYYTICILLHRCNLKILVKDRFEKSPLVGENTI